MKMMDAQTTELFNLILKRWRAEGKKIGWPELNLAAELAWEAQETRAQREKER